jgi:hypothetical protein
MNNPVEGCRIKGSRGDWEGLPDSKSLFRTNGVVGIPIGNLTSQVFANLYLNDFDHYVKRELKVRYYGRYVDDMVLVHHNKEFLKAVAGRLSLYLDTTLGLNLHPRKNYLQHYTKGVQFVGIYIKPYRRYAGRRIHERLKHVFRSAYPEIFHPDNEVSRSIRDHWIASANSYLGICRHYDMYRLCEKLSLPLLENPAGLRLSEAGHIISSAGDSRKDY